MWCPVRMDRLRLWLIKAVCARIPVLFSGLFYSSSMISLRTVGLVVCCRSRWVLVPIYESSLEFFMSWCFHSPTVKVLPAIWLPLTARGVPRGTNPFYCKRMPSNWEVMGSRVRIKFAALLSCFEGDYCFFSFWFLEKRRERLLSWFKDF